MISPRIVLFSALLLNERNVNKTSGIFILLQFFDCEAVTADKDSWRSYGSGINDGRNEVKNIYIQCIRNNKINK